MGANSEISNLNLVKIICEQIDRYDIGLKEKNSFSLVEFTKDRIGHDFRYSINTNKIRNEIGWVPKYKLSDGIPDVINWYLKNKRWLEFI